MSTQLYDAAKAILAMPYYKNQSARSGTVVHGHEDAVASVLPNSGFIEVDKKTYPGLSKSVLRRWSVSGNDSELRKVTQGMPVGTFIKQPAGSQGFPDILVLDFNNRFVAFECKSSKGGTGPMWNDSLPKPNAIYIMNSGKYNETTMFIGSDVISKEEQALMDEQEKAIEKIVSEYKAKLSSIDRFNRGWFQKSRRQHFQYGGGKKTNYFTHADRAKCEKNVLDFCKQ